MLHRFSALMQLSCLATVHLREQSNVLILGKTIGRKHSVDQRFPGGATDKESACHCWSRKRHSFDPWVRRIPWRRA